MQKAYRDAPQPIGYNATISAPHMHAACLEILKDNLLPGNKVSLTYNLKCNTTVPNTPMLLQITKQSAGPRAIVSGAKLTSRGL